MPPFSAALILLLGMTSPSPASTGPAFCSVDPPIRFSAVRTRRIVDEADVVVRVVAVGSATEPGRTLRAWDTDILAFEVREVLRGDAPDTVRFGATVADWDDFQEDSVPYLSHRLRYSEGDCINRFYRIGAEYLLLLGRTPPDRRSVPDGLTPYWAILAPTNEQLRGPDDPWLQWVRDQVRRRRGRGT